MYFDAANHSILSDIFENANKKDCHLNFDASYTKRKRFEKHETCELLYISSENKTPTFYEEEVYYEINKSYEIFTKGDSFQTSIVIESQAPKYFQIEKQKIGRHEIQKAVSESFDRTSIITPIHICRVMVQNDTFIPVFKTNRCRQIPWGLRKEKFSLNVNNDKNRNVITKLNLSIHTYQVRNTGNSSQFCHIITSRATQINSVWIEEISPTKHPPINFQNTILIPFYGLSTKTI